MVFFSWFTDIDECKTGLAKCKQKSYCRNEIGSYYCSCVPNLPIFNWVARFTKLNYADCYGKNLQCSPTWTRRGEEGFWEFHQCQARVRLQRSILALVLQPIVVIFSQEIWFKPMIPIIISTSLPYKCMSLSQASKLTPLIFYWTSLLVSLSHSFYLSIY